MAVAFSADIPADEGNACTLEGCSGSSPSITFASFDSPCDAGVCDAFGVCVQCNSTPQCPSATECRGFTCSSNVCVAVNSDAGLVLASQTSGDCKTGVCDGGTTTANNDTDVPGSDGNLCTNDTCSNGVAYPPATAGTFCATGMACDGNGVCMLGNLVVVRVGTPGSTLSTAATDVFLDYHTFTGTLIQSTALPVATSGSNARCTLSGTATSEGALTQSVDHRFVTLGCYDADAGTANVVGSTTTSVNRVVARIDAQGAVDTSTRFTAAFSGANIRGAGSSDGVQIWAVGTNSGPQFTTFGVTAAGTQVSASPTNVRTIAVFDGQLYGSSGSGAFVNVFTVGTGLPTISGNTCTSLPGMPTSGASPYGFVLFDQSPAVPGVDLMYVADDRSVVTGGGIQKWTFNGTTWSLVTTFGASSGLSTGVRGITGLAYNGNHVLAATTTGTPSQLIVLTDDGSASPAATVISSAPPGTVYRGVALVPQ
jgi:hypothetical protein